MNLEGLTDDEKKRLRILLHEAQSRGLTLQRSQLPRNKRWPMDSRGFFVKADGIKYNPYEQQEDFVKSNAYLSAFTGSRGCGKSGAGSQKALIKIAQGQDGAVMNPDFENLKISTWPEFREWIPWDMVIPRQRYRNNPDWQPEKPFKLTFTNGVNVIVKGVKDPDSARGPNINWLWFDEGQRDDTGASWQTAVASVRVGLDPQAWVTATPAGVDHWLNEFFVLGHIPQDALEAYRELKTGRDFVAHFRGTIFDNRANLDAGYYAMMLAAYPAGWLRQQEIYGEFVQHSGALGDRTWFNGKILPMMPEGVFKWARFWDLAATEKKMKKVRGREKAINDPDETVGTKVAYSNPSFYIKDQVGGYWDWDDILKNICLTAELDGPNVKVYIEQEPGSGGKNQVAAVIKDVQSKMSGYHVEGHESRKDGDKVMRANIWFAEAKQGYWYLISGDWNEPFLAQVGSFGVGRHDDKIDSVSGARIVLAPIKKWRKQEYMAL